MHHAWEGMIFATVKKKKAPRNGAGTRICFGKKECLPPKTRPRVSHDVLSTPRMRTAPGLRRTASNLPCLPMSSRRPLPAPDRHSSDALEIRAHESADSARRRSLRNIVVAKWNAEMTISNSTMSRQYKSIGNSLRKLFGTVFAGCCHISSIYAPESTRIGALSSPQDGAAAS